MKSDRFIQSPCHSASPTHKRQSVAPDKRTQATYKETSLPHKDGKRSETTRQTHGLSNVRKDKQLLFGSSTHRVANVCFVPSNG
ncbi:MAG: hypothetical protein CL932_02300 [Deltaproteobacteria bacterium]|nr:hypothetical protein [Deltaproteobacteria bacterium]